MKNFLNLLGTNIQIPIHLTVKPLLENGVPRCNIKINNQKVFEGRLDDVKFLEHNVGLLDSISISIKLYGKIYNSEKETAILVQSLKIDHKELTSLTTSPISYSKDQDNDYVGFYLGFNGLWQYNLNKPFYQWYHIASDQGWLFEPA